MLGFKLEEGNIKRAKKTLFHVYLKMLSIHFLYPRIQNFSLLATFSQLAVNVNVDTGLRVVVWIVQMPPQMTTAMAIANTSYGIKSFPMPS